MSSIPTIELFKGDKRLRCNVADKARFEADGWVEPTEPEAWPEPDPEPVKKPAKAKAAKKD